MNPNRAQAGYFASVASGLKAEKKAERERLERIRQEVAKGMQENGQGHHVLSEYRKKI